MRPGFFKLSGAQKIALRMGEARIAGFYEKPGIYGSGALWKLFWSSTAGRKSRRAALLLDDRRDELFTYAGLDLSLKRYCIRTKSHVLLETPQEMYPGHRPSSGYEGKAESYELGEKIL